MSNIREYFFQTVSNSSWANESYLSVVTIEDKAYDEFTLLTRLHGVGLIKLNVENPDKSSIIIPATKRSDIDFGMVDKIFKENKSFQDFMKNIHTYLYAGYML